MKTLLKLSIIPLILVGCTSQKSLEDHERLIILSSLIQNQIENGNEELEEAYYKVNSNLDCYTNLHITDLNIEQNSKLLK